MRVCNRAGNTLGQNIVERDGLDAGKKEVFSYILAYERDSIMEDRKFVFFRARQVISFLYCAPSGSY